MWQQLKFNFDIEPDLRDTVDWGRKQLVAFNASKTHFISFDCSDSCGAIDMKKDVSVLYKKSSFKMLLLFFSSKLDCGSYIVSIAKTTSKKIGALIHFMKFFSPEVAFYLYEYTIRPCMEYCCHVWPGGPNWYLDFLNKLQKRLCRDFGPTLAVSPNPLAHLRNVASLNLLYSLHIRGSLDALIGCMVFCYHF